MLTFISSRWRPLLRTALVLGTAIIAAALASPAAFAAISATSLSATQSTVAIDGQVCPGLRTWSGGEPRAVVNGSTRAVTGAEFAPLRLEFDLPMAAPVQAWVSDLLAGRTSRHTVLLTESNANRVPIRSVDLREAVLTQVRFEELNATAKVAAAVTLVIRPGYRTKVGPTAMTVPVLNKARALGSSFRFSVPGLPSTGVSRVAPLVIGGDLATGGQSSQPLAGVANVVIAVAAVDAQAWRDWRDAVLGFGPQPAISPMPMSGDLTYLSTDLKTELMNLHFDGLSIVEITPLPATASGGAGIEVELACAKVSLAPPTPSTGTSPVSPAAPAPSPAPTPTETKPATVATAENTSPKDLGARDPKGFPRPAGLVRESYKSTIIPTQTFESAYYQSTLPFDELSAAYLAAAKADGWKAQSQSESGDIPSRRLLMVDFIKGEARAHVRVYGRDQGSSSSVEVTTPTPK
ncbi:hypothetical protein [Horticoccus sp. 23ND18S-11]|uniref:hypothetical protein n=1 Tax=Horticoccus sp. 23ND18S-11 TaxID=3391832 RepID=UPI0039C8E9AA